MVARSPHHPLRIAMVSPYDIDVPGGVQSHVQQLAEYLTAGGDEVVVIAPGERDRGRVRAIGGSVGLPFNDAVAPIAVDPRVVARVRRVLRQLRPDVVHVHEPLVPLVGIAAVMTGVAPVVGTFHAWSERDRAYRLARPLGRRVWRRLAGRIAVSDAAAEYHTGALGVPLAEMRVIPNGVDVARFRDVRPLATMQGTPSLLFVGRLEPRKGLAELVTAFVMTKQDHPDLRLYVVGEGPERERAQRALPQRLRSDVVFLGRVDDDELARLYATADVYVSPATGGESFGIVLVEAMAAGATVVASDLPGYRSVVADGVNGVLVEPGNPGALAARLNELLSSPARRRALADEAADDVARFDWSVVAGEVREVYLAAA